MAVDAPPEFIYYDDSFRQVTGPSPRYRTLVRTDAHEGPVYLAEQQALYFTTVPRTVNVPSPGFKEVAIRRLDLRDPSEPKLSTVRERSNMANGMTQSSDAKLLVCEQGTKLDRARISELDPVTNKARTVVDRWFDLPFNSPNDIVVRRADGTIWFTDPSYGGLQGFKAAPMLGDFVYRFDPRTGELTVVADSFDKPNGLAFSVDERTLYINDSGAIQGPGSYEVNRPHHIRAFDVRDDRQLTGDRLFAVVSPGIPDGLKIDARDNVYSSSGTGVKVYAPSGKLIGEILAPGVANFTFGGPEGNELYMMTDTAIVEATLAVRGALT